MSASLIISALRCCAATWSCLILASASSCAFCCRDHLEFLDGAGDVADLVLAAEAGQHHGEIAAGEFFHRHAEGAHRTGDREDGEHQVPISSKPRQIPAISDVRSTEAAICVRRDGASSLASCHGRSILLAIASISAADRQCHVLADAGGLVGELAELRGRLRRAGRRLASIAIACLRIATSCSLPLSKVISQAPQALAIRSRFSADFDSLSISPDIFECGRPCARAKYCSACLQFSCVDCQQDIARRRAVMPRTDAFASPAFVRWSVAVPRLRWLRGRWRRR